MKVAQVALVVEYKIREVEALLPRRLGIEDELGFPLGVAVAPLQAFTLARLRAVHDDHAIEGVLLGRGGQEWNDDDYIRR